MSTWTSTLWSVLCAAAIGCALRVTAERGGKRNSRLQCCVGRMLSCAGLAVVHGVNDRQEGVGCMICMAKKRKRPSKAQRGSLLPRLLTADLTSCASTMWWASYTPTAATACASRPLRLH